MKNAIMLSVHPKWVAKILSGEKTIEIRNTTPKCALPIDVYIYCTKGGVVVEKDCGLGFPEPINGKVVAKFTLKKVGNVVADGAFGEDCGRRIFYLYRELDDPEDFDHWGIYRNAAITEERLASYLRRKNGYAWHIDDLVVFDKPKDLSEFGTFRKIERGGPVASVETYRMEFVPLTKAPQSWQYIEKGE